MLPVAHIYLLHYAGNAQRREFQLKQLGAVGVNATFVTAFDDNSLDDDAARCLVSRERRAVPTRVILLASDAGNASFASQVPRSLLASLKLFVALFDMHRSRHRLALIAEDDMEIKLAHLASLWVGLHDVRVKTSYRLRVSWETADLADGSSGAAVDGFLRRVALNRSSFFWPVKERSPGQCQATPAAFPFADGLSCRELHPRPLTALFSGSYNTAGFDMLCCTTGVRSGIVRLKDPRVRGSGVMAAVGTIVTAYGARQYLARGLPVSDNLDQTLADSRTTAGNATQDGHYMLKPYVFVPSKELQKERLGYVPKAHRGKSGK